MESPAPEIAGILVTLKIGETQSLFVVLHDDGSLHRMGTGCEDEPEHELFIGRASPDLFAELQAEITPKLLAWCGQSLADPTPQGKTCQLLVGFKLTDGSELTTAWEFGTESEQPPLEVYDFVAAAVRVTDPWYEEQKRLTRPAPPASQP